MLKPQLLLSSFFCFYFVGIGWDRDASCNVNLIVFTWLWRLNDFYIGTIDIELQISLAEHKDFK